MLASVWRKALEHPLGEWCRLGRAEASMKGGEEIVVQCSSGYMHG